MRDGEKDGGRLVDHRNLSSLYLYTLNNHNGHTNTLYQKVMSDVGFIFNYSSPASEFITVYFIF